MRNSLLFTLFIILSFYSPAQEKTPVKFGKISADDFKTSVYSIDSNAAAVVVADVGYSRYEGNERGWFTFFHERHKRVHILNKAGYDAADVQIPLYVDGNVREDLVSLKAYTYNLENGKVQEIKLENKNVFTEVVDKNHVLKKFTFPGVKEGSIIEFSYNIKSDFWSSPTNWYFQGKYPVLWSELEFHIPEFFYFVFITEGYINFYKKEPPVAASNYFDVTFESMEAGGPMQRERRRIDAQVYKHRWVIKDAPGLRPERFTSSIMNHISRIEFQLSELRNPLVYKAYMQSWPMFTERLLTSEYFGQHLSGANNWLDEEMRALNIRTGTHSEKAKAIYDFVRDNFTCTDHSARYLSQNLKNILKARKGNVADINLLLITMLKNAGINAEPVLLSTKDHGYTYAMYPLEDKFNYVVARVDIDGKKIFLDATRPRLRFGLLSPDCYNGFAVVVNKAAEHINFDPDSLSERNVAMVLINNDENNKLLGRYQQQFGEFDSYEIRNRIIKEGVEAYFTGISNSLTGLEIKMTDKSIDSLKNIEAPLSVKYDFEFVNSENDILYFNPMLINGYKENPFKSTQRFYPVEMPYAMDETYIFRMEIPAGYTVEELPKSAKVNFDETGTNYFEYMIGVIDNTISLRSRLKLSRTYYATEEYEILREFFEMVVSKHAEQVVFKKSK